MANFRAIYAVGESLKNYLRNTYPTEAFSGFSSFDIRLISSGELAEPEEPSNTLSLFLHRVTINEHLRNTQQVNQFPHKAVPLSVDLHYLMTVWATSALAEHMVLAWAMRQFHCRPILDVSSLLPEAGWELGDTIQLIPVDLTNEDIMRIWDKLRPPYRLSVGYVARVIRLDTEQVDEARPVIATRFTVSAGKDVR